jgi:branched-chain amino acid transport system substrate-binding protein
MRKFTRILCVCVVTLSFIIGTGCAFGAEPIRVGVLIPLTGAFAGLGADGRDGTRMAFEEIGNEINGRKIELFFEDTAAEPNLCIQKTQRLVEREGVQLILGPLSGGEGVALKDYADRIPNTTVVVAGAAAENITMRGVKDNVFRTAYSGAQVMFKFGEYAYDTLGYRKMVTLGEDYDFPFSQIGGFVSTFTLKGGKVLDRLWVNVGTSDYSSVISRIPSEADAILVCLGGTDSINFIKQFNEFGLGEKIKLLGSSITVDTTVLQSDSGPLLEGVYSGSHYAQVLPYPEFAEFDKNFEKLVGRPSSLFAADYYIGAKVAIEALKAIEGKIEDQKSFRDALLKVKIDTPRGPFWFDEFHNVVENVYINRVVDINGTLRNDVVETFVAQDQFGPFDPEWYQSQPPFDRINPTEETLAGAKYRK